METLCKVLHVNSNTNLHIFGRKHSKTTKAKHQMLNYSYIMFVLYFFILHSIRNKHTHYITINDNDVLSYSLTTMMHFLTKEWYGFSAYTVNLFIKAYHRITYQEDLKSHKSTVSLRWCAFYDRPQKAYHSFVEMHITTGLQKNTYQTGFYTPVQ